ncbi:hypothetical protein LZQ00_08230 [Sphingobacterium sp. SRCM116780]|uniref:hypothetical protein n=1 Tax=Sphingobacterium sp. SRCM116780 TaxID=2907623 RepID=UPI001F42C481|nr:hypothetical protein [Sphingobacterium sp. SRCM116780]UIR57794.1 hypothetical protein LZQ00_08230 [Sphingobacterium sp. SRCM116780]
MKANDFVEGLKNIKIDVDLLKEQGISDHAIEGLKNNYIVDYKGDLSVSTIPVIQLVENYNCSKLEIGMITFKEILEETEDYIYFGKFEMDDFAIDRITGKIIMQDLGLDYNLYELLSVPTV